MAFPAAKIKEKKPGQRACGQKDEKGKLCVGHLKRWYTPSEAAVHGVPELEKRFLEIQSLRGPVSRGASGPDSRRTAEALLELGREFNLYRCERCHTLYHSAPADVSTAGQRFVEHPVNILGEPVKNK